MPFKDKLKSVFHHKKTNSTSSAPPPPEIIGSSIPPRSKDPGFRKSFNLNEDEQESVTSSRPISVGAADSLAVPKSNRNSQMGQQAAAGGAGNMYTVDPYDGDYMSVSPRTRSTIPDNATTGSNDETLTAVPSLNLNKSGAGEIEPMESIGEGKVLEGATEKLQAIKAEGNTTVPTVKEGGTLEPFPTRTSEASGTAYGSGAYTAPQRTNLAPVVSNDATSSIYSDDISGTRPGLGPPRDTDASVYSSEMISGLATPKNEEIAKRSGLEEEVPIMMVQEKREIESTMPDSTQGGVVSAAVEETTSNPNRNINENTTTGATEPASSEQDFSKSVEPTINQNQAAYTSLLKDVMAEAHTPQPQQDRFNQPTRFHQPGDFFSAVKDTFPESAPAASEDTAGFQTTGYGVTPAGLKGDDAATWSKGVISGIDGVNVQTPREERRDTQVIANAPSVSGILDQASEEVEIQDGGASSAIARDVNPVSHEESNITSGVHPYFAQKQRTSDSAGIVGTVSAAASTAYNSVANNLPSSNTTGDQGVLSTLSNATSDAYNSVVNTATGKTSTERQAEPMNEDSSFVHVPEHSNPVLPNVDTFGDPDESTPTQSPTRATNNGIVPTVSNAVSNAYNSASEALVGTGSATNGPTTTNESTGIVPTISNAVGSAYNSAAQTISNVAESATSPSKPTEHDADLEKGFGAQETTHGTDTTAGISNLATTLSNYVSDNLATTLTPSTETKAWANDLYDSAAKTVTGGPEEKQADAIAGILGSQHIEPETKAVNNAMPHTTVHSADVPDVSSSSMHDERPNDVPFGEKPITTTSNAVPVASFNQATPATAYGKNDIDRDVAGSQAEKAFVDNEFDQPQIQGGLEQHLPDTMRPGMKSMDTTATIDVVKGMPGGMW